VALGGNAFASPGQPLSMPGQLQFAHRAMSELAPLFEGEAQLLICHGNGPQVGQILTRVEQALGKAYAVPLEVCVAESEGELGYVLEQAVCNILAERQILRPVVSLLTQVIVDADDPAFTHPSKPIGVFYSRGQAAELTQRGFLLMEDAGRGYRRIVPSPRPRQVLEADVLRWLLEMGVITIAAGGGGIPVVRRNGKLEGVEAVVDKDLTAALLADELDARLLVILTDVPQAYRFYRTPREEPIGLVDVDQLRQYLEDGQFAAGSMWPKVEAALRFINCPERRVIITNPASLGDALRGSAGTIVEMVRPSSAASTV
jgi:carbamate kinase